MPTLESITRLLAERDTRAKDDPDWIWRNNTAWRWWSILNGGLIGAPADPAPDFGLHYLTQEIAA